jgi:hypothetical protein
MKEPKKPENEAQPVDEKMPILEPEDLDESQQSIEIAAYHVGMERADNDKPKDESSDWAEAEKEAEEDLD